MERDGCGEHRLPPHIMRRGRRARPPLEAHQVRRFDPARHATEVQNERGIVNDLLVVDRRVGGDDADQVGGGEGLLQPGGGEVEVRQLGHVGIVVLDIGAEVAQEPDDLERR